MPIAFPEPEEINRDNLCPTCHKDLVVNVSSYESI